MFEKVLPTPEMSLAIQIIVVLEILISCILRSEEISLGQWANQPGRNLETVALRGGELKGSPPGWRRVCRMSCPQGPKGGRTSPKVERIADNLGLDEEMLLAAG